MTIKDGDWELFSHNPSTGATTWRLCLGNQVVFRTDTPVDAILADNQAAQAHFAGKRWTEGLGDPVASIPMNVYMAELQPMEAQGDKKAVARWLNDPDNAAWRMKSGRV
jgi:hypothetical protein